MLSRSRDHLLHFGRKDKEAPNHLSFALLVAASAEVRDIMRAEMWLQRHDGTTHFQFKHNNLVGNWCNQILEGVFSSQVYTREFGSSDSATSESGSKLVGSWGWEPWLIRKKPLRPAVFHHVLARL